MRWLRRIERLQIKVEVRDGDVWRHGTATKRDYFDGAWHYRVEIHDPLALEQVKWARYPDEVRRLDDEPWPA